MSTLYFGPRDDAPVYDLATQVATPVGQRCDWCRELIELGDRGFVRGGLGVDVALDAVPVRVFVHRECDLRQVVGGLNHQRGTCRCQGGPDEPDPSGMTAREAARAAVDYFYTHVRA